MLGVFSESVSKSASEFAVLYAPRWKGKVYALDIDKNALIELKKSMKRFGLKNIEVINGSTKGFLKDNSMDVVLCYDVVHYMKNRMPIYNEAHRVLKPEGLFSLYPKHHKDDYPLMELANLNLENVVAEIKEAGFTLRDKFLESLLHDEYFNKGHILNFKKS